MFDLRVVGLKTPLRPIQARTSTTELSEPNWLATFFCATGSGIHSPSTRNLYSYCPGDKASVVSQRPSSRGFIGIAVGDQPLNSPQRDTALAPGLTNAKLTVIFFEAGRLGACVGSFFGTVAATGRGDAAG